MNFLMQMVTIIISGVMMASGLIFPTWKGKALVPAKPDNTANLPVVEQTWQRAQVLSKSYYRQFYFTTVRNRLSFYPASFENSSCWEYIGLISLTYKLALADAPRLKKTDNSYLDLMDDVLEGLRHYRKESDGKFAGYVVQRNARKEGTDSDGIAYDDNMWLGRDFVSLYELSSDEKYLTLANEIADYLIAEAYVPLPAALFADKGLEVKDEEVGGFYWDHRCDAVHTCSTGPAAQFLAALYRVGGNETYLKYAKAGYNFLSYLENDVGVFHDLMRFEKDTENNITAIGGPDPTAYAYNSGSPITAAVELYRVTNEQKYLDDAIHWAQSADAYFAKDSAVPGVKEYPVHTTTWFNLILLNGYTALYPYWNGVLPFIENMRGSIDYAYENHRTKGIGPWHKDILPRNWVGGFQEDDGFRAWALDVSAAAEIYATLHAFYAEIAG